MLGSVGRGLRPSGALRCLRHQLASSGGFFTLGSWCWRTEGLRSSPRGQSGLPHSMAASFPQRDHPQRWRRVQGSSKEWDKDPLLVRGSCVQATVEGGHTGLWSFRKIASTSHCTPQAGSGAGPQQGLSRTLWSSRSSGNAGPAAPHCPLLTRGGMSRSAEPEGVDVGGLALPLLGHVGKLLNLSRFWHRV